MGNFAVGDGRAYPCGARHWNRLAHLCRTKNKALSLSTRVVNASPMIKTLLFMAVVISSVAFAPPNRKIDPGKEHRLIKALNLPDVFNPGRTQIIFKRDYKIDFASIEGALVELGEIQFTERATLKAVQKVLEVGSLETVEGYDIRVPPRILSLARELLARALSEQGSELLGNVLSLVNEDPVAIDCMDILVDHSFPDEDLPQL